MRTAGRHWKPQGSLVRTFGRSSPYCNLVRPVGDGANRKRQVADLAVRMGLLFSCEDAYRD